MKKVAAFVLLCILLASVAMFASGCETIPQEVDNDSPRASNGLWLKKHGDGLSYVVAGIGSCKDTDIVIPLKYDGLPVSAIEEKAFFNCDTIVSVTVPKGIKSIGKSAFGGCGNLTSITLPFIGQTPNGTENTKFSYIFGKVPKSLKSLVIPDGITEIKKYAFSSCDSLENITIPDSVTVIEEGAFSFCGGLKNITIPDSVTVIEKEAFSFCSSLKNIELPNSVTSIEDGAFDFCISLTSFKIGKGISDIPYAFLKNCVSLKEIVIPENIKAVNGIAFYGCKALTKVIIGNGVQSIYYDVFWGCQSLSEVIIGESLKKIDGLLFSECENLTSVTFENTLGWYLQRDFGDDVQWNVTDPRANAVKLKNMFNENLICI